VRKVVRDERGLAVKWKVRWLLTTGKRLSSEHSTFKQITGNDGMEVLDVDTDNVVAVCSGLTKTDKLPSEFRKDARAVLLESAAAVVNGTAACNECGGARQGNWVSCVCCSRVFHLRCAQGCTVDTMKEWWCKTCEDKV